MRRADRLFQIVQRLHPERTTTAATLADELAVSERTIYRDIQDLSLTGVPIIGETGHGYRLMPGYRLSPLMFTEEELSALLLGARMVQAWSDPALAKAAGQAMDRIEHVLPDKLRPELLRQEILVPDFGTDELVADRLEKLRTTIRKNRKVDMHYTREDGQQSERTIHPLGLFYWGKVWTLVAWCELRDSFRHFRVDRIRSMEITEQAYPNIPGRTLQDFLNTACK
jgi:predicted DNA-binding transcriptional regulator YafY